MKSDTLQHILWVHYYRARSCDLKALNRQNLHCTVPENFKVGTTFVTCHRLYGVGGTQPSLRETLQCDDIIVLKW